MLKTQNHVLSLTTTAMPSSTSIANFTLPIKTVGAPWQTAKKTTGQTKIVFMLSTDIFAPPEKMEIIHAQVNAAGTALYSIDRGMEGTAAQPWPVGTHVVSIVSEAALAAARHVDEGWKVAGVTSCSYRKLADGMVEIKVEINVFDNLGKLPSGYRPTTTAVLPAVSIANSISSAIQITTLGVITVPFGDGLRAGNMFRFFADGN